MPKTPKPPKTSKKTVTSKSSEWIFIDDLIIKKDNLFCISLVKEDTNKDYPTSYSYCIVIQYREEYISRFATPLKVMTGLSETTGKKKIEQIRSQLM